MSKSHIPFDETFLGVLKPINLMELGEALKIIRDHHKIEEKLFKVYLSCGFTPLHLKSFVQAQLIQLKGEHSQNVIVETGLYGDLVSQFEFVLNNEFDVCIVMLEWSDLDPRLGLRSAAGWSPKILQDIENNVEHRISWLIDSISKIGRKIPTVISLPTLPFPPVSFASPVCSNHFETKIKVVMQTIISKLSDISYIKFVSSNWLDQISPFAERWDLKSELNNGFPYTLKHASALAKQIATLVQKPSPKKGLITDLDDTLWRGILGEVGSKGVSWDLDNKSHVHALYQQVLQSLADTGVLVAVASKNEISNVNKAFERNDLLLSPMSIFPIEAHWQPKSESVGRILKTWNIGDKDVVFIDDSPTELAQVKSAFPDIECILFPKDENEGLKLLIRLRELFGKSSVSNEDGLRLDSIRNRVASEEATSGEALPTDTENFLQNAGAIFSISFSKEPMPPRALELINKTNQFNLNGKRYEEAEWSRFCARKDTVIARVAFKDKFGPLGTIAVLAGHVLGTRLIIESWVLSCRAFSRRIEHQCLNQLFKYTNVKEIEFAYLPTAKNGPTTTFLTSILGVAATPTCQISYNLFTEKCLALYHQVKIEEINEDNRE